MKFSAKMRVKIYAFVVMIIIFAQLAAACSSDPSDLPDATGPGEKPFSEEVLLNGYLFELELALTPSRRAIGLMGRRSLPDDRGMIFVYPDSEPYPRVLNFWMKGCLIPIDVIFLDREGIITAIHQMEVPSPDTPDQELVAYSSERPAQFAIELKGGRAAEIGLAVGDRIILRTDYLLGLAE
jgi:uncharacterized protein